MSELIVVERSSSLSHLLTRTLQAADLGDWRELASTVDALAHIKREVDLGTPPRALLLGAPARVQQEFRALLEELGRNPQIAVLLLGHERLPELDLWLAGHPAAEFLPWAQFGRIPAILQQLAPANTSIEPVPPRDPDAVRVLFVDDSASVRMTYQSVLLRQGYAVDLASTRQEALARAQARRYDLIVVDYYLPDGNGEMLCRELRQIAHTADALIAVITGSYRDDIIRDCLEAGAIECMFKSEAMELFTVRIASLARQVQMQKRVASERERLDGILSAVADGVYGVDRNGMIGFINPNGLRLLGFTHEDQVVGRAAHELFHPMREDGSRLADEDSPLTRAYSTSAPVSQFETVFWTREGGALPVECSLRPLTIEGRHEGAVAVFRDISDRKSVERLHWDMTHDGLTGLANTRHFLHLLGMELARRREQGGYAALLYIDVDRYRQIGETAGISAGENLLVDLARRFGTQLRDGDALARLDRDRFGLLLPGVQPDNLFKLAENFRALAQQCDYEANGTRRQATVSVGVGLVSRETPSVENALERAREACEIAKHRGRDQTQISLGEVDSRLAREIESGWAERLREAIAQDRLVFYLQPIVPIAAVPVEMANSISEPSWSPTHAMARTQFFELLVRLRDARGDLISPSVFIPLAERFGLMPELDLWIVARALKHLSALSRSGVLSSFTVNLSSQSLSDNETLRRIEELVRTGNAAPGQLVFELTETSQLNRLNDVRRFMLTLRGLGCRFALDDFGTGFSSFTHLRHLPVDFVKIDGSFVEGMVSTEIDHKLVSSITGMARALKLRVIAEHVDSPATLAALRACGVEFAQGHFLGKPRALEHTHFARLLNLD